jgi:hypothetical protein
LITSVHGYPGSAWELSRSSPENCNRRSNYLNNITWKFKPQSNNDILPQSPARGPIQSSFAITSGADILQLLASDGDCNVKIVHSSIIPVEFVQLSIARCKTSISHPF